MTRSNSTQKTHSKEQLTTRLLPWLVLAIGLAVTYFLQHASLQAARQIQQDTFHSQTRQIVLRIAQRLETYEQVLRGLKGLYFASKSVERDEFKNYADNLQLADHFPGIQGIGYSLLIPAQEKDRHIAAVRKEGFPGYRIYPPGERDLYTSILYLEPFSGRNVRAFGYDMYSEPVRRAAMAQARDRDEPVMSGKVRLVQEIGQQVQAGSLIYLPVYRNGSPHATLAERRTNLVGWVYAPFRMNDLMQGILGEQTKRLDYEIFDGKQASPETLMYDNDNHLALHHDDALYHDVAQIRIAGHDWTINLRSLPDFENNLDTTRTTSIRLTGTLMSMLLALLVWQLNSGQQRALGLAKRMTQEFRESETFLKEAQAIANLGNYILDADTGTWQSSEELDRLFGIDEVYPRSIAGWEQLIHPEDRSRMDAYLKKEVLGRHKAFDREYRIVRHNDKTTRWVHGLGKLKFDAQGRVILMSGTIQDITVRKESEATLIKLSSAVEQSMSSVVITDLGGHIEYVNPMFTTVTGYSHEEAIGRNPRFLQSGKTPRATYADLWDHLTRGLAWHGELINRNKEGREYIESVSISPIRQSDGKITNYLAIEHDITEKKQAEERIERLAHFDQLTGLPNRSQLIDHFNYARSLAQRNHKRLAVLFLDLDHFKNINDTLGHSIGDQLLMETAKRVKQALRKEDSVSRLGGDEFIFIIPETDESGAAIIAGKLIAAVSRPWQYEQHELIATPSIGIALYPNDGEDFETLSRNADIAMYRVKQSGRNNFCFYTSQMQEHAARTLQLSNALRHALERDELHLNYQPQISIQDGRIVGAEALLRWNHPEFGMISPAEFIPIAEDNGLIIPIGEWVLRTAAGQLKAWMDGGMPAMVMAVNMSSVQFHQANIIDAVTRILQETQLPPQLLELELTEAVAMKDPLAVIAVMDQLHELGIRMSIDDFGTGYSSLNYLKKFKVYKLKIDQSFVRDITDDPDDKAIVAAIINMASSLGIQTIAEGVETAGQLAFLRLHGCDEVQGYYFSKPLTAQQFEAFATKKQMEM